MSLIYKSDLAVAWRKLMNELRTKGQNLWASTIVVDEISTAISEQTVKRL